MTRWTRALGTMADLERLAHALHDRGMALCVDLVLNHTAQEHAWARKALAGDREYRDFYRSFPIGPSPTPTSGRCPRCSPTWHREASPISPETDEWVWTSFHEFQWDLNWSNPKVFRAMLGRGVHAGQPRRRRPATRRGSFLWKRLGTDSQNQPEAHRILQAFRALTRLAMPGLILKAEAIVGPDLLVPYLGGHDLVPARMRLGLRQPADGDAVVCAGFP